MLILLALACNEYSVHGDRKQPQGEDPKESTAQTVDSGTTDSGTTLDSGSQTIPVDSDPEAATESVYINTSTTLFSYDPSTNRATAIGDFKEGGVYVTSMTDIAIDLNGHMYGGAFETLYEIDPRDASCTEVDTLPDSAVGLTFLSDGRLVVAGSRVFTYDPSSGTSQPMVKGAKYATSGDIVGLPDGFLYWVVQGGNSDELVRVDPSNGDTTWIGPLDGTNFFGIGYTNNTLYAFSSNGEILAVDPSDASTVSKTAVTDSWWGATTNPVKW